MVPYRLVMAMALLTSPPERLENDGLASFHPELAPALRQLALGLEILDPRETEQILSERQHFAADLRLLAGRWRDLADAPSLTECSRLPTRAMANDFLSVNRTFQKSLEARLPLDPLHADDVRVVLQENEHLYQVWDAVRAARCEYYYVTARRKSLKDLRDLIGARDFYSGNLPPNVPMWRID